MEENTEVEVLQETGADVVVLELQAIRAQNETLIAEIQSVRAQNKALSDDILLLVLFVAVIMIYKIRDVFLSFVKKGGLKRNV